MAEGLEIVTTRAFDTEVRVDGGEEASADSMVVVLVVGDVSACAGVTELFGETKVDDVDDVV